MKKDLENELLRKYLLGILQDEETLQKIDEQLFSDEDFFKQINLIEDEIIEEYANNQLSVEEKSHAENYFFRVNSRKIKLSLIKNLQKISDENNLEVKKNNPNFSEKFKAFFSQFNWQIGFIGIFLAMIILTVFWFTNNKTVDEIAELSKLYKDNRPTISRISGFDYAPIIITRGENEVKNLNKLKNIELKLSNQLEKSPTAENYHAYGIFYLTQKKFPEALKQFDQALKLKPNSAQIRNDLAATYLEQSEFAEKDKQFELLTKANEELAESIKLDNKLLAAWFNKAICLQKLGLDEQSKSIWKKYLEFDSSSNWANEAKENLEKLEKNVSKSRKPDDVYNDFWQALKAEKKDLAWKIYSQTKEMITEVWLPDKLSRKLLENQHKSQEISVELKRIGEIEKEKSADFFVSDLSKVYENLDEKRKEKLIEAKSFLQAGYEAIRKNDNKIANEKFNQAKILFAENGNQPEADVVEYWILITSPSKTEDFVKLAESYEKKNYKFLQTQTLIKLASNYFREEKFSLALKTDLKNLENQVKLDDTYSKAKILTQIGMDYAKMGELEKALKYVGESNLPEDFYYQSPRQKTRDLLFAAQTLQKLKSFESAIDFETEHLELAKKHFPTDDISLSNTFFARIYLEKKDFKTAETFANKALELAQTDEKKQQAFSLIGDIKRETKDCESALANYENALQLSKINDHKFEVYLIHKGKMLCFQELSRKDELKNELDILLESAEDYRSKITQEDERHTFFENEHEIYNVAIDFALNENVETAFNYDENSKARSLLDLFSNNVKDAKNDIEFEKNTKNLEFQEIRKRLPKEIQVVQFAVLPNKIVAWNYSAEKEIKTTQTITQSEVLENQIEEFLAKISQRNSNLDEINASSKQLYKILIEPLKNNLEAGKTLCIIPDKTLSKLPFHTLKSSDEKFLIEDFPVFYSPSSSILILASEKGKEREAIKEEKLLAFGNPKFDGQNYPELSLLESSENEVKEVAKNYSWSKVFISKEATKERFSNNIKDYNIIQFSGHYIANPNSQKFSKMLFADGELYLNDFFQQRLDKAKLVVLSACQTNVETSYKGEGGIGVARAFLAIGSPIIIASNWKVENDSTMNLMIKFHQFRKEEKLSSIKALQKIQIEMLKNQPNQSPYYWASFSVIGGFTTF